MTRLPYATATEWANDVSLANDPRLTMLEAIAAQQHPAILAVMSDESRNLSTALHGSPKRLRGAGTAVLAIVAVLIVLSPLFGWAALIGHPLYTSRLPIETSFPVAAWSFAIAALGQIVGVVIWLAKGRPADTMARAIPVATSVLGLLTMTTIWLQAGGAEGWSVFLVSPAIATALAGAFAGMQWCWSSGVAPSAQPGSPRTDAGQVAVSFHALPRGERDELIADRNAALAVLEERGLLTADQLRVAVAAPFGTLPPHLRSGGSER